MEPVDSRLADNRMEGGHIAAEAAVDMRSIVVDSHMVDNRMEGSRLVDSAYNIFYVYAVTF